jgi:hypothetical protein
MLYEIVNPSDAYTVECPDLQIAMVVCILLGRGQYALRPLEENAVAVPMFMFGGLEKFCEKNFKKPDAEVVQHCMKQRADEVAAALDSVLIGSPADRAAFYAQAPTTAAEFEQERATYHDKKRSSLNDIGGRAYQMAANLRTHVAKPLVKAPQQIFVT